MNLEELKKLSPADRERLFKRVLPTLAILVISFVFISPKMTGAVASAKAEITTLKSSGSLPEAIPGLQSQSDALNAEIRKLEQEQTAMDGELSKATEFLKRPNYANQVSTRLAAVLENHHVFVLEDRLDAATEKDNMPKSLREIRDWVVNHSGGVGASARSLRLRGSYNDVYAALNELAHDGLTIVPIALGMRAPDGGGELEWTLELWI